LQRKTSQAQKEKGSFFLEAFGDISNNFSRKIIALLFFLLLLLLIPKLYDIKVWRNKKYLAVDRINYLLFRVRPVDSLVIFNFLAAFAFHVVI
jgi:hypothetical protein